MPADTKEALDRGVDEGQLVRVSAASLLRGCVRIADESGGWKRPWRFSADQVRTMGSCHAWHPGLFRQMARCTAGITLDFQTDSTEIALEVLLDVEPTGTKSVLDPIREEGDDPLDGVSATVDGRHLACVMPDTREAIVRFELDDPNQAPLPGLVMLPGFGDMHHVRVWLPALRGCAVRSVWGNGTAIEATQPREQLLVIGDSIAQGFVTGDPALTWPSLLSEQLGLDLVNQGLGGQIFQPGTLFGLASLVNPSVVVVALGENYRYEPCRHRPTARDIRSYLMEVTRLWPEVPTYVYTPLWHDEQAWPSHRMSCWQRVPSMIEANVAVHDQMVPVDGLRLIDHDPSVLAHYSHPQYVTPDLLLAALSRGDFFGAFEDGELVGFIGEHPEGAIGLLEVFEGHRGKGWGRALEATKINQALDRGQTPWVEVFAENEASLALQRKLNMTITAVDEQLFLCKNE